LNKQQSTIIVVSHHAIIIVITIIIIIIGKLRALRVLWLLGAMLPCCLLPSEVGSVSCPLGRLVQ